MAADNLLDILRDLKGVEWPTKTGLFKYGVAVFLSTSAVIFLLNKIGLSFSETFVVVLLTASQILHFILWLLKRYYLYDPDTLIVAFAIKTDEASHPLYKEIKKRFREQIISHRLHKYIKVKELPSDIHFVDSESAESFVLKKGVNLLVWGHTEEGNVRSSPYSLFKIRLSYQFRATGKKMKERFGEYVDKGFQRRKWGIRHPESFQDLTVVAENILETSMYTLGACLSTSTNVHYLIKSIEILEKLRNDLKVKSPDYNFPTLNEVKHRIRILLLDLYLILMSYYWDNKKHLDKSCEYANKLLKLDDGCFFAHQNMAYFEWRKGNNAKAHYHTDKAWEIRPGHSLPRFNRAYFYFCERRFEEGLKEYKKIEHPEDTNIIDVIEFLEKEFERAPDNLGFLFASGRLNIVYADPLRGTHQLERFLSSSRGDSQYGLLITEANKLLAS